MLLFKDQQNATTTASPAVVSPLVVADSPNAASPGSSSNKRKASSLDETDEGSDGTIILSMPAHKLVLMAKSVYFHTRLSTAVGDSTTATIREHAGSLQELHAMAAVVEFMYTDKLPSTSIGRWDLAPGTDISSGGSSSSDLALTQRLVITLTVR